MSAVNDFLKNRNKVWLDMRTTPDLQELDKQVSSRHKRLPFLHPVLFRIPFMSPGCPAIALPPIPFNARAASAVLWKLPVEDLGSSGKSGF